MNCPHSQPSTAKATLALNPQPLLKAGLPPLIPRIAKLPRDERGYPIPFFVAQLPDGKFDFRIVDPVKLRRCVREKLCWVCGEKLGKHITFPIGPMCMITRVSSEPPSHTDCAEWSVRGCPFLSKPAMERREDELTEGYEGNTPGVMIKRNPGVIATWTTHNYKIFNDGRGGALFELGEPEKASFWREGRAATRAEIMESIKEGLPQLQAACPDDRARRALEKDVRRAVTLLPA